MSKMSTIRPPTPPKEAAIANLALLLRPPELESKVAADEANPPVELAEDEDLLGPSAALRPGAGSGVGDPDDDNGLMVKLWVDSYR